MRFISAHTLIGWTRVWVSNSQSHALIPFSSARVDLTICVWLAQACPKYALTIYKFVQSKMNYILHVIRIFMSPSGKTDAIRPNPNAAFLSSNWRFSRPADTNTNETDPSNPGAVTTCYYWHTHLVPINYKLQLFVDLYVSIHQWSVNLHTILHYVLVMFWRTFTEDWKLRNLWYEVVQAFFHECFSAFMCR